MPSRSGSSGNRPSPHSSRAGGCKRRKEYCPKGGRSTARRRENEHRAAEGVRASRGNPWLEIDIDPQRLVIGAGRTGIDPGGAHARRERGRNKTVVDALARRERRTFVFAVPGSDPRV